MTNPRRHRVSRLLNLFSGTVGTLTLAVLCLLIVAVAGLWLGPLDRTDAIGIEGVLIAVLFGTVAIRTAVAQQHELVRVLDTASAHEMSLGKVRESIESVTGDAMRRMSEALLTEHLGSSPDFLLDITTLVERARRSLRVLCDHPAYLIFSNGPVFDDYLRLLRERIAGCTTTPPSMRVELMFLDEAERRELHEHQIRPDAASEVTWQEWVEREAAPRNDEHGRLVPGRLVDFWCRTAHLLGDDTPDPPHELSVSTFVDRLLHTNSIIRHSYLTGAEIHDLQFRDEDGRPIARRNGPTVYFWLRDEDDPREAEAIFAIVPLGAVEERAREQAFSTRDPQLIDALVGIFERYRQTSVSA